MAATGQRVEYTTVTVLPWGARKARVAAGVAAQRHAVEPNRCLLVHRIKVQQHARVPWPRGRQHQLAAVPHARMVLPHARQVCLDWEGHLRQQQGSRCIRAARVDPAAQPGLSVADSPATRC